MILQSFTAHDLKSNHFHSILRESQSLQGGGGIFRQRYFVKKKSNHQTHRKFISQINIQSFSPEIRISWTKHTTTACNVRSRRKEKRRRAQKSERKKRRRKRRTSRLYYIAGARRKLCFPASFTLPHSLLIYVSFRVNVAYAISVYHTG